MKKLKKIDKNTELAIREAFKIIGGQSSVAGYFNIRQQSVADWLKNGVPPCHVIALEKLANGTVTRYELRPDLYPRD